MLRSSHERTIGTARERFLGGAGLPTQVRKDVLNSWRRCSIWSVPPDGIDPPYRPNYNPDAPLIRAAAPVLQQLAGRLGELGVVFLLTDAEARILARSVSDPHLLRCLDRVRATPGHVFTEEAVGTNGLGTAVELGRTARVDGHEHYMADLGPFSCVGVPIIDHLDRRRIGVLDVTCSADHDNKLIELIAEQAARAIEARLVEQRSAAERALLEQFLAASRHGCGGVVVVNDRLLMTDPHAARLLGGMQQPLLWERAARVLSRHGPVEETLELADGRRATARMTPLDSGGRRLGVLMELRADLERGTPAAGAPATPDRASTLRPPGLAGRNDRYLEAYQACRAARVDQVVAIGGEPGAGKLSLAEALHRDTPRGPVVLFDAAARRGDEEWLPALRRAANGAERGADGPATLIVRAAHLLSEADLSGTWAVLDLATRAGWQCLVTHTLRVPAAPPLVPGRDVVAVTVPPLRDRLEDSPELVAAFAAPRRVAPEAVQLLARLPWCGNIRELRAVVNQMLASAGARDPGLRDIPVDVRGAAPRRPLSRFEQAELHAILAALAEAGGNKKRAAGLLGISRSTLYRKLQTAGCDLENTLY